MTLNMPFPITARCHMHRPRHRGVARLGQDQQHHRLARQHRRTHRVHGVPLDGIDPGALQGTLVGVLLGAAIMQLGDRRASVWTRRTNADSDTGVVRGGGSTVEGSMVNQRPTRTPVAELSPPPPPQPVPALWDLVWRPLVPPKHNSNGGSDATSNKTTGINIAGHTPYITGSSTGIRQQQRGNVPSKQGAVSSRATGQQPQQLYQQQVPSSPQLMLQGLTPAARQQVLMLSLSALETITTRDHQQPLSSRHVIAEASCMACRAMLGVVLPELAQQARDAMMEQRGGDVAMGEQEGMEDHGAAKMQAQNAWLDDWQSDDEQDSATDTRGKSTSQAQEQQQPPSGQWVGTLWQSAEGKMGLYDGAMKKAVGMLEAEQGQHTEEQRSSQDVGTDSLMYTRHGNHSNDVTGGTHGEGGMSIREQALAAVQQPPVTLRGWAPAAGTTTPTTSSRQKQVLTTAAIMHDMAVTIAEAVASSYLSQARAGTLPKAPPDIQGTVDSPQPYLQDTQIFSSGAPPQAGVFSNTTVATYVHPSIASSRSLERFRNQVLLAQWVDRKWWGVRRVLEDTQQLWLIRPGGRLQPRSLAVKRTQELEAFTGWPLLLSLLFEVGDVVGPLLLTVLKQARVVVSWLLVAIIGQAVGLVYRGVRQSMGGRDVASSGGGGSSTRRRPWWWPRDTGGDDGKEAVPQFGW